MAQQQPFECSIELRGDVYVTVDPCGSCHPTTGWELYLWQAARAAPSQRDLTVPEEKAIDAALFSTSKLVGVEFRDGAIRAAPAQPEPSVKMKPFPPDMAKILADNMESLYEGEARAVERSEPSEARAPAQPAGKTALERFNELKVAQDESDPVEQLRAFCSFAMTGQDWLDVEPFFDAITAQPAGERVLLSRPNKRAFWKETLDLKRPGYEYAWATIERIE